MRQQAMPPAHPGEVLKGLYLDPLEITITKAAENLDISRRTLSMIINGHIGISAEMALRLSMAFDTPPELWMDMQKNYDLWNAKAHSSEIRVKSFVRRSPQRSRPSVPASR